MRKTVFALLIAVVSTTLFVSCKKGDDDPFVSFRTRKHRVVNEWKLKNAYAQMTFQDTGSSDVFTLNATDLQMTLSHPSYYPLTFPYTLKMNFEKDGKFSATEVIDGETNQVEGTWNFNGRVGDDRNKESITIYVSSSSIGSDESYFFMEGNILTYKIKELREKKLVLAVDNYIYTAGGDYIKLKGTYTFQ